jgi:hypothetical protein
MTTPYTPPEDWSPADYPESIAVTEGNWWVASVNLSAQRIRDGSGQQAQVDARHLVIALRQLLYAAELQMATVRKAPEPVRKALGMARARFDATLPGVVRSRNRLIHFAELVQGVAKWLGKILASGVDVRAAVRDEWYFGYNPTTGEVTSGADCRFTLDDACRAAAELSRAIWWAGHVYSCDKPAQQCPACRGVR